MSTVRRQFVPMLTGGFLVSWLTVIPCGVVHAQTTHPTPQDDSQTPRVSRESTEPSASASGGAADPQAPMPAQPAAKRDPNTGSLRIIVLDDQGAAIVGATVHVTNGSGFDKTIPANQRGEAVFDGLQPGKYNVHAEFPAFDPIDLTDQNVKKGNETKKQLTLQIGKFVEQVEVTRDETDKQLHDSFSTGLTKEEIDQLPDDPDEMADVLTNMAGPGATMWVNGFNGGRLPSKDQIANIRFRFDPYSADNHDAGLPRIDIVTKPGNGDWRNNLTTTFRNSALNGKYPLAADRADEQSKRGFWTIDGPIQKGKTSFSLSLMGFDAFDSSPITATGMGNQPINQVVRQPNNRINFNARVEHQLTKTHTLRFELQRMSNTQENLGVGQLDLPSRGFTQDNDETVFRISDSGQVWGKSRNEIRLQINTTGMTQRSLSDATTIIVQGAFHDGGQQASGGTRSHELQISDDLDFTFRKKHAFRAGFLLDGGSYRNDMQSNTTGTYTFATAADYANFLAGLPIANPYQFTQRVGNPLVTYDNWQFGAYITDEVKLTKTVMLDAGVRYELQTHLSDYNNFGPRVHVTWAPFKNNRTTVRAGVGIFYDWFDAGDYAQTVQLDGTHQFDLTTRYNDPNFVSTPLPPSIVRAAANLEMPAVRRESVGFEHQITGWLRLRTNFFFDHRWNRLRALNENFPEDGVRPDPNYLNIAEIQSIGESNAHGMDLGLNIMIPKRSMFAFVNYTLQKAENDGDSATSLPASNTLATEWGPSRNDVRNRLFAMFSTPLPKSFRTNINFRYQSASPYTITLKTDSNGDLLYNDRPAGVGRNSARGEGQVNVDLRLGWTRAFGPPRTPSGPGDGPVRIGGGGGRGGGGRGGGGGDMGGGPINPENKRYAIELFAQANNLLNTANYTAYNNIFGAPNFGLPLQSQPPRRIELGMRLQF